MTASNISIDNFIVSLQLDATETISITYYIYLIL